MVDHGQILATGREHFISAIPLVVQANQGLYGISAQDRKCYLYNEKKLAFYRHYTEDNCYTECRYLCSRQSTISDDIMLIKSPFIN